MELLTKYLPRIQFESYEDFKENFTVDVPDDFDFARDVVDAWAALEPNKRALHYCNDAGQHRDYTFAEIADRSRRAASYFAALGIRPGDRVLTLLRRRAEYWIVAVALHRLGATVVPASIQLTEKDIVYRVALAQATAVISVDDDFVNRQTENLRARCPSLRELIVVGDAPVPAGRRDFNAEYMACLPMQGYSGLTNDDEMVIYFTSGTSGYPKMAIHDRTYPLGHIVTAKYMQRVQNNGLHLTQADSGWAKFGWGNIYGQWLCGTAVLAYDPIRFDSEKLMNTMRDCKPTSVCIPPTMYRFLMRDGLRHEHIASVKWFATAGEALSGELNSAFRAISGQYIHEGYGQSEGTPISCSFEWVPVRPASMGKPSPLYKTALMHADGSLCKPGEDGEVVILTGGKKQLGLLKAYYGQDGFVDPCRDGIYHTGDRAYEDADGYYWYVGRADDIIKSSGYRIGPFEIESVLNTHPAVLESAVVGCPHPVRGQIVCAVLVLRDGFRESEELTKELQAFVKTNTAPYKYPRKVCYVPELPKTTSGKIIRSAVKTMV